MHDIFCMHIGQCGLQIGFALWELLLAEHGIERDGRMSCADTDSNYSFSTFFNLSMAGQYVPRSVFVDLEPTVIDQMRTGSFRQIYHPDQLINGYEDAANNFARGFHTVGRIMKRSCENRIRKEFEMTDRVQGIHIYRSLGGGTGSGMTATLFESLLEYPKTSKIEIPIHPSPHLSCSIVEPYNCILSEHFCMDDIDISVLIDNESLYDIMVDQINVKEPNLHHINRLVAQVCSSLTASIRFDNELHNDFTILTNLVPYPRIHFPLVSYAPFGSESKISRNTNTVSQITHSVFDASNQLVKCDPISGKYMSCSLVYRGEISPTQVFSALAEIKASRFVRFVDWCPTGFKVGIVNQPPQVLPNSKLGFSAKNVVMMTNSSAVSSLWHRLAQNFHKLYSKRSFVHWFVAEGLEESEFCESLYNIATLAKDYEEVALDTKVEEQIELTPLPGKEGVTPTDKQDPEGGSPTKDNEGGEADAGAEAPDAEAEVADDADADADDDDADDEENNDENNDNASNMLKPIHSFLNNNANKSINWRNQFEKLVQTLHQSFERRRFPTKSMKIKDVCENMINKSFILSENDPRNHLNIKRKGCQKSYELDKTNINEDCRNICQNSNSWTNYDLNNETIIESDSCTKEYKSIYKLNKLQQKKEKAKIIFKRKCEESLLLCSSFPSCKANSDSLIELNNDENSFMFENDNLEDETTTFSLMESLIRMTSFNQH